jgi:DNA mismatch repair protein MSH4
MKYISVMLSIKFTSHSLRISYAPPEGSVTIDTSTLVSLELIQNMENPKSKQCLFGLLNLTQTPMGARILRTNILQPSTDIGKIELRLDAVAELCTKQEVLFAIRQSMFPKWLLLILTSVDLKDFVDAEKILTDVCTAYVRTDISNILSS